MAGGGTTPSGPAAVVFEEELWTFVRGGDDHIYQNRLTAQGWTGWSEVAGGGTTPSGPAAWSLRRELWTFVRGGDDRIYQNHNE